MSVEVEKVDHNLRWTGGRLSVCGKNEEYSCDNYELLIYKFHYIIKESVPVSNQYLSSDYNVSILVMPLRYLTLMAGKGQDVEEFHDTCCRSELAAAPNLQLLRTCSRSYH